MKRVTDFLSTSRPFYYGTLNGDQPEVRPFGFFMEYEGKLYFGMGKHKNVYRQTLTNPKIVVSTTDSEGQWLRIRGIAVPETDPKAYEKAFEISPQLTQIYNKETGLELGLVYVKDGSAELNVSNGAQETFTF